MNLLEYYKTLTDDIRVSENKGKGLYTVSYLHAGVNFEDIKYRQARGLTLDSQGNVVTRGFEKFFNYKQLEDREDLSKEFKQEFSELQDTGDFIVDEKLDGTLILLSLYKGEFIVSTTSSTQSEYSENAQNYFNGKDDNYKNDLKSLLNGKTLVMEYVSLTNQIVVKYDVEEYVLLSLVDNNTGEEVNYDKLIEIGERFNLRVYSRYTMTLDELLEDQKSDKNIEGYVIRNSYGRRIKIKLDSWFESSRVYSIFYGNKITKNKVETILESYLDNTVDDLIAYENQNAVLSKDGVLKRVLGKLQEYLDESEKQYKKYENGELTVLDIKNLSNPERAMVFNKVSRGEYISRSKTRYVREHIIKDLTSN